MCVMSRPNGNNNFATIPYRKLKNVGELKLLYSKKYFNFFLIFKREKDSKQPMQRGRRCVFVHYVYNIYTHFNFLFF
jgi:hypothetical protein